MHTAVTPRRRQAAILIFLPPPLLLHDLPKCGNLQWPQLATPALARNLRAALSGALAEVSVNTLLYPLDTWKTRVQFGQLAPRRKALSGLHAGLVASALDAFVFTLVYESLHDRAAQSGNAWADAASGLLASLCSTMAEAPFAVARDRIRLGLQPDLRAAWRAARQQTRGASGLFAGALPALLVEAPAEAAEYATYERVKRLYAPREAPRLMIALAVLATGGLSGLLTAPLDLAVTRVAADPRTNRSVFAALATVVRQDGAAHLFRGASLKAGREALSSAFFFLIYDSLKGDQHFDNPNS